LTTSDPRVLMAVHVNAHEGLSGSFGLRGLGGVAGIAGKGGKGGVGGEGGKGGTYVETVTGNNGQVTQNTKTFPKGNKGPSGTKGTDGLPAVAGGIGKRGKCGVNGLPGKILFRVVDTSGRTIAEGPSLYDPALIYLTIADGMKVKTILSSPLFSLSPLLLFFLNIFLQFLRITSSSQEKSFTSPTSRFTTLVLFLFPKELNSVFPQLKLLRT
jgi:hypothetical protein